MRRNRSNRVVISLFTALAAMALLVAAPSVAFAQQVGPTDDQYGPGVLGEAGSSGPSDAAATRTGSAESADALPFTGLDVAAIAAIGIALVGAGFLIRRVARAGSEA